MSVRRAAFLDRDGVINVERGYVHRIEDFELLPGVVEALRLLRSAGYALVVVTNQSGIARGYYTEADYQALTAHLRATMSDAGCELAGIYHCPHHPSGTVASLAIECECRKPQPGMLLQSARDLGISLSDSFMVGDKLADAQAARAAGVGRVYLVRSGHALESGSDELADATFDDLAQCARHVVDIA